MTAVLATQPAIECVDLCYRYADGTVATAGVNLRVERAELLAILGPNGAGKTTLVRQIAADLAPATGTVRLFGKDVASDHDGARRLLGVIPQHAGLFPGLTVEQHLRGFAPLKGVARGRIEHEVQRVIAECGLTALRGKRAQRLSGGEQRRVLVALALLGSPAILVLDEPTTGLDPFARKALWDTIQRQRSEGKTIVLTSHYLDEVEHLADRIALLDRGRLVHVGTQSELCALLPRQVRVISYDEITGNRSGEHLFDSLQSAQRFVSAHGLASYTIGRVRLEDVYFHLVGRRVGDAS